MHSVDIGIQGYKEIDVQLVLSLFPLDVNRSSFKKGRPIYAMFNEVKI